MPRKRRNTRRSSQKKGFSLLKLSFLVIVGALTYKGADYFLPRFFPDPTKSSQKSAQNQKKTKSQQGKNQEKLSNQEKEVNKEKKDPSRFGFQETQKQLPKGAFKDNFQNIPIAKHAASLIAHSKIIQGKKPGPKGETHTRPGLRYIKWNGKDYETQDLDFKKLKPALGSLASKKMMGIPKVEKKPFFKGKSELYLVNIFFEDDSRNTIAFIEIDDKNAHWASLHHASGKKIPAAFTQGTSKETTRKILTKNKKAKPYIIIENGELDEFRPYAGYTWNVQAYYWDGKRFVYDAPYSKTLTRAKRLTKNQ